MIHHARLISRSLIRPSIYVCINSQTMPTFVLPNTRVTATLNPDITREQLLGFPAFKNWLSSLEHSISLQDSDKHAFNASPYKLQRINVQAVDWFGGKK